MSARDTAVAQMRRFVSARTPYVFGGGRPISMANGIDGTDCSGSVIAAWEAASPGCTGGAGSTATMRRRFTATGKWRWHKRGDGYVARPGDVYLYDGASPGHTAMCTDDSPDILAELYPPRAREVSFYEYPWSGTLEWIGDDDEVTNEDIEKIADKAAEKVWTYMIGTDATMHKQNKEAWRVLSWIHHDSAECYTRATDTSDPTGRGQEMTTHDHVKWLALLAQKIYSLLKKIAEKLGVEVDDEDAQEQE